MCNNKDNDSRCIAEILEVINILQRNSECPGNLLDTCDRGFLGCNQSVLNCNTRPVMLFTCCGNGVAWSMPISKDPNETQTSNVFRVEKVDGNCATFRVLTQTDNTFAATNSFFTMDLDCICALRCLQDTFVECI